MPLRNYSLTHSLIHSQWPLSWKIEIFRHLGNGSTDFYKIWQGGGFRSSSAVQLFKMWNLKNPRWRQPPSWKIEKSPYLRRGLTDFDKRLSLSLSLTLFTVQVVKISKFLKCNMAVAAIVKLQKSPQLSIDLIDRCEIWYAYACWPS